jgi:drug/metabolite transporter (DMT)-like permease
MRTRAGLALAFTAAIVSGFAVYTNSYGVRAFGNATAYTTAKNLVAALVLLAALSVASAASSREGFTRPRTKQHWAGLAAVAVIGGSVPFVLFFQGLSMVSAASGAFTYHTLVIWVALLAVPLLRERLTGWHLAAIAALVCGQALLGGGIHGLGASKGEAMILAATLMWAVEVIVVRHLLRDLTALTVAGARMGGGVLLLLGWTLTTHPHALTAAGWHQWSWALATGLILAVNVAATYAALARIGAIDVTAIGVSGAIITALLQGAPDWAGVALIAAGTALALLAAGWRKASPALAGAR